MKCNKCCAKIAENEEIQDSKKFYCETCWKSDSWKRTGSQIAMSVFVSTCVLFCLVFAYWFYREAKNIKPKKCDRKHYKDEDEDE